MSRAFRIGVFVVGALAILGVGIFLIGNKEFLFSPTYTLKADFQNAGGLINGADVRVGGIHEGTVERIELPGRPDGKVTVVMRMKSSTRSILRKDSVASIKTEGLLGDKYVEISFGSDKGQEVANGDAIRSETTQDVSEQAAAAAAEAKYGAAAFRDDMEALKHNFLLRGFFKKRGYNDAGELTQHAIAKLPAGPRLKEFDYDARKLFDAPDSAKLIGQRALNKAGKFLEENQFGLAVVASSEALGDSGKDRVLTEARAKVVRDYLAQNFRLDDTRIKTLGLGKPKQPGENSKVQIFIYPVKAAAPSPGA